MVPRRSERDKNIAALEQDFAEQYGATKGAGRFSKRAVERERMAVMVRDAMGAVAGVSGGVMGWMGRAFKALGLMPSPAVAPDTRVFGGLTAADITGADRARRDRDRGRDAERQRREAFERMAQEMVRDRMKGYRDIPRTAVFGGGAAFVQSIQQAVTGKVVDEQNRVRREQRRNKLLEEIRDKIEQQGDMPIVGHTRL